MKTTVILIRHGEVDNPKKIFYGRSLDISLNQKGEKQLTLIGKKLAREKLFPENIYSSPLKRAVQSSKIILKHLKKKITLQIEPGLIDVDIPALVGHPIAERDLIHSRNTDEYDEEFVAKGNEPRDKIVKRMERTFWKIAKKNKGKISLIVSHGDPLRFLLFRLFNRNSPVMPISKEIDSNYVAKGQGVKLILDKAGKIIEKKYL